MGRYLKVVPGRAVNTGQAFDEVYLLNDDGTPWTPDNPAAIAPLVSQAGPVKTALDARFVSALRIPDLLNSWWAYPDCVFDPARRRVHITGATRGGAVKVAWFDLLSKSVGERVVSQERHLADDHYTRSMMLRDGKVPLMVGAYHDRDANLRTIRGKSFGEWDMLEAEGITSPAGLAAVAYGQFIGPNPQNIDNGIAAFFRGGDAANYLMRSTDYGATWSQGPYKLHDKAYMLSRRNGNNTHFLSIDHPSDAAPQVRYFKWAITSTGGSPKTAAGAGILGAGVTGTSIWDYVTPDAATPLVAAGTDLVRAAAAGTSQRVFDMTRNARYILLGTFADKANLAAGCTYKVMARQTADTSNTWSEETLDFSGPAFGPSGYVGGACFAEDGSVILIINRAGGAKTVERWVRTGADFAVGTWAYDKTLYTAPSNVVALGRPRTPIDCNNLNALVPGIVTFGEYHKYDPASFLDFYGDQLLVEF